MVWDGLNRRRFPRVVFPCLIKVSSKGGGKEIILTHTQNIGVGGAGVMVKKEFKLFADVELEIDLLDELDHIKTNGKIVWVVRRKATEEIKPMFYDIGIEFVSLPDRQQGHLQTVIDKLILKSAPILKPYV